MRLSSIICFIFIFLSPSLSAQHQRLSSPRMNHAVTKSFSQAYKTNGDGDTLTLLNFPDDQLDSLTAITIDVNAPIDSGYIVGMNVYNDKGFAERYGFNANDSGLKVIGAVTLFRGTVNPASTRTIDLKVWKQGSKVAVPGLTKVFYDGLPGDVVATQSVPVTSLGISDSLRLFYFNTPTGFLGDSFFIGYQINYNFANLNGDIFSLLTTRDGYRYSPVYNVAQNLDTIINVQNSTMYADNVWHDNSTDNFSILNHYCIFPVVEVKFGNFNSIGFPDRSITDIQLFPNPAKDELHIALNAAYSGKLGVYIFDMSGKLIVSDLNFALHKGNQNIQMNIKQLSIGSYIAFIKGEHTGLGIKFDVLR